jgi:hypothetical protein
MINYPIYYKTDQKGFEELLSKADIQLGLPNGNGTYTYCNPIIDINGDYWFTVNLEVANLVDPLECFEGDSINFPNVEI